MSKKNIGFVILLSFIISVIFIVLSTLFAAITNYNPLESYILINIIVWCIEFIIAYFIVMGTSRIIYRKIKLINKWIMYISLLITSIFILLIPGGLESAYIGTFLGIISVYELIKIAYNKNDIMLFNDENKDQ